ncbi:MAG: DNA methyltransferase [Candidatus Zixiibacteriota bacterium]
MSFGTDMPVFLIETSTLAPAFVRYITKVFSDRYLRFLLFLTVDYGTTMVVFPDYEKRAAGEHKLKITKLVLDRKELHYTDVETLSNLFYDGTESSWRDVWRKWRHAFNVERVTEKFFEDYKIVFFVLRSKLDKQGIKRKDSHEFTLQFLNRIMFIYFISKKRWLNNDPRFMKYLWNRYLVERNAGKTEKDSFYDKWLKAIFFKAFNNRASEIRELPADVKDLLGSAPYLNGGLFTENEWDKLAVKIDDTLFRTIFEFFEKYNFTIREDMPLESEVAVDPQMLGYVYESLAKVAEEIYDRNDLGIFYTPRVEVDFMCMRSLVEYLAKHLPNVPKDKFYQFVFDDDKEKVEQYFGQENLWRDLERVLDKLSIVDPACGSGAFLVGMLRLLADLYKVIYRHLKRTGFTDFSLKEAIVGRSLYGVDVMSWAVHAAELRLWLHLIVEAKLTPEELRRRPLLPNLNLNLRVGDSLVQEIGGIKLHLRTSNISRGLRDKLLHLRKEKERYFYNSPSRFSTKDEIMEEETRLFGEIIDERVGKLKEEKERLNKRLRILEAGQRDLYGKEIRAPEHDIERVTRDISNVVSQTDSLRNVKKHLKDPEKKPFVWEIDFAEIFGDKDGFDVVIGNPPYVRQEIISPPDRLKAEVDLQDRRAYKDKLIESVQTHFPMIRKIDRKSDYYIYFYFHGLSILNEKGTFCFITSNSWLDVGYGRDLQEFLLRYVPITAIYDNPKRSFAHAGINTIIAILGSPKAVAGQIGGLQLLGNSPWSAITLTARFVMFKKSFEQVLSSRNLIEIESVKLKNRGEDISELVKNVVKRDDYRVFPVVQEDLLEDGWEYPVDYDRKDGRFRQGKYSGNKWGGKYLRAPDIFYTIVQNSKEKLVELGDIAKVRRGFTTGANEFFYLDEKTLERLKIESRFLRPVIKSPKECNTTKVGLQKLRFKVFICDQPKSRLKGTKALEYIKWGERQTVEIKSGGDKGKRVKGYHKLETVKNRRLWYDLGVKEFPNAVWVKSIHDNHGQSVIEGNCLVDQRLYEIRFTKKIEPEIQAIILNNSVFHLFKELEGRVNLGEGVLDTAVFESKKTMVVDPSVFQKNPTLAMEFESVFEECGLDPNKPIREQEPRLMPDRKALDDVVFDVLGLTQEERKEVYWAVCELVKERLDKARSLRR